MLSKFLRGWCQKEVGNKQHKFKIYSTAFIHLAVQEEGGMTRKRRKCGNEAYIHRSLTNIAWHAKSWRRYLIISTSTVSLVNCWAINSSADFFIMVSKALVVNWLMLLLSKTMELTAPGINDCYVIAALLRKLSRSTHLSSRKIDIIDCHCFKDEYGKQ